MSAMHQGRSPLALALGWISAYMKFSLLTDVVIVAYLYTILPILSYYTTLNFSIIRINRQPMHKDGFGLHDFEMGVSGIVTSHNHLLQ